MRQAVDLGGGRRSALGGVLAGLLGPALLALALLLFLLEGWKPIEQMDDAYISYRYAQNLVNGHGLVFNAGEWVEGYTNLSWTLMVAAGMWLGMDGPQAGHWLGLFCGLGLLWASYRYAQLVLPRGGHWLAGVAPLLILASNSFACWSLSGLETPLFAWAVTAALRAYALGRMGQVAAWSICASLTRPEGALLAGVLLGWDWLMRVRQHRPCDLKGGLRLSGPVLAYAIYFLGHLLFRLHYYGDYVPNTFHAKVGGIPLSRGFDYLYGFLKDGAGLLLLPALWGWRRFPEVRMGVAYLLATCLYILLVGGDVFSHGRFLLPVFPVLVVAALAGVYHVARQRRIFGWLLGATLPASMLVALYVGDGSAGGLLVNAVQSTDAAQFPYSAKRAQARNHRFIFTAEHMRQWMQRLARLQPPVRLVAAIGIGQPGYFAGDMRILDLVGLTDRHIAKSERTLSNTLILPGHHRTDAPYALARKPDVIMIPRKDDPNILIPLPAMRDLWNQPALQEEYYWDDDLGTYLRKPELRRRAQSPRGHAGEAPPA